MNPLTLTATLDRQLLPATGGQRFLRVTLRAAATAAPAARKPLNLAFVLDRSGSMAGDKLRLVKEAVAFGIGQLTPDDRAAVVVYDNQVTTLAPSGPIDSAAKTRITLALGGVEEGGSTALGEGWLTGCRLAAESAAGSGDRWLTRALLLTDGLANVGITDPAELTAHALQLRQRGVTTTTLGVGHDFDEQLLNSLAEAGGGNFYFIEQARQIPEFFAGELGELLTVVAEQAVLTVTLPPTVRGDLLNDYPAERGGKTFTIEVGAISAGEEKTILLALRCRGARPDAALPLAISLRYRETSGEVVTATAPALALRGAPDDVVEAEVPDREVLEVAGRFQAARAKREALTHIYAGRADEARQVLAGASATLAAPAMAPAAAQLAGDLAELAHLAEEAPAGWGSAERKQVLYNSTVVRRSRRDYGKSR